MISKKFENINHSAILCADFHHEKGMLAVGQQIHKSNSNLWIFSIKEDEFKVVLEKKIRYDINAISFNENGSGVLINGFPNGLVEMSFNNEKHTNNSFGDIKLIQSISEDKYIIGDDRIWKYNAKSKERSEILEEYIVGEIQENILPDMNHDLGDYYLPYANELPSFTVSVEEKKIFVSGCNKPQVEIYDFNFELLDEIPFPSFQTSKILYNNADEILAVNSVIPSAIFLYNTAENKFVKSDIFNKTYGNTAQIELNSEATHLCTGSHLGYISFYIVHDDEVLSPEVAHDSFVSYLKYDAILNTWISTSHDGTIITIKNI